MYVCMYADAVSSLSTIKFFCNLAEFCCNRTHRFNFNHHDPAQISSLQVLASGVKIYMVMEFVTGGELFDKIVS